MNGAAEKQKILIVDDMPVNLKVLNSILVEEYHVFVTSNSLQALEKARSTRPDLILLDIVMPEIDGFEVCRRLKEEQETLDIPVIFITAMSGEEDEVRGFAVGAVDYISKPFKASVVLARVRTHLKMQSMQRELIRQNAALLEAEMLKADIERIMRHDLKSPMASVVGCADLVLTSNTWSLPPDLRKFIQMIHEAGHNALRMISLSLDMYKMEQGTYLLEPKAVDLVALIGKLTAGCDRQAQRRGWPIDTQVNGHPMSDTDRFLVSGEDILCYSIFSNLIKNAKEASPANSPITVTMDSSDTMATISIHNAGAVPAGVRERFFEKYVTSGKKTGTGLGTYSARLMAEVQRGSVRMETSEESGTTVTVRLPAWVNGS
ncbi:MAG: hybrid sensor histidine kinase/response regulator [Magnetococcus sp. DMHC-8]